MADIEANLKSYLCGKSGVTSLFGATAVCRIFVDRMHPSTTVAYPYAIIRTVQEAEEYAHDGELPATGLYQIDVYSSSKTTVNSGIAAIKTELSALTGTVGTAKFGHCFAMNTRGGFDPESNVFKRSTDYEIGQNG